jgi:uncharacterized membrane protein
VSGADITRRVDVNPLSPELSDQDKILLVFAYLGPLALFSLVAGRKEFVKWHAKQGALLALSIALVWIVVRGLYLLVQGKLWALFGTLFWGGTALTALGLCVLLLLCIVRALEGERFKIPVLGGLADAL